MKRTVRVQFYEDHNSEWRWRLIAANSRIIADSGEGYASRRNAERAWQRLREVVSIGQNVPGKFDQ